MSNIRQIRSISRDSQDPNQGQGQGRGAFSGGGFSESQNFGMGGSWSGSASAFGGPLISPPIQFHEIPIIQI